MGRGGVRDAVAGRPATWRTENLESCESARPARSMRVLDCASSALRDLCRDPEDAAEGYSGTRIPSSATQEPVATTGNSWIPSTIAPLDGERRTSTSSP